jgi:Xaa-Pro aminopeptidase
MSDRTERLTRLLAEAEVDLMLVSNLVNVRYLTGYTGSNGLAIVGPETRRFLTDFRYVTQAEQEVDAGFERLKATQDLLSALSEVLPRNARRVGFEEEHVSVRQHARLQELLGRDVELVPLHGLVEGLRAVKDATEVARIRAAVALADAAFAAVMAGGVVGRSERDLALALEVEMRRRGGERASFDTIVAAGANGALPHAQPRDVEIAAGDLVVFDWGAQLDGYCSDCTRTVAAGTSPSAEATAIYELVLEAQLTGLRAVRAGAVCREVDATARGVIETRGHREHFGHGLGHGVGLDIHEAPRLSQKADGELRAGNVVTVEPGVYLPGAFGVRIEDLVVVTADGCEILTGASKELKVVD